MIAPEVKLMDDSKSSAFIIWGTWIYVQHLTKVVDRLPSLELNKSVVLQNPISTRMFVLLIFFKIWSSTIFMPQAMLHGVYVYVCEQLTQAVAMQVPQSV